MKIAFIGQKGIPAQGGGIEAHVQALSTKLSHLGLDVTVYARKHYIPRWYRVFSGVNIVHTPSLHFKLFDTITHVFTSFLHAMTKRYDVIALQGIGPALLLWMPIVFVSKTKVVFTFHCKDYEHQKWGRFARLMLRLGEWIGCTFADKVICVSKGLTHYVKTQYGRSASYIPNGVETGEKKGANHITKQWGLHENDYILCVSRLIAHKGIHYLVEAFKGLKTDKKLVIVGDGTFTDSYVKALYVQAQKDERIIFTGRQTGDVLDELYSNAFAFVHPSTSEGLSIALLEALSYGKSVIASDIPENMEVISDCAMSFENKNVKDLKAKLQVLLSQEDGAELFTSCAQARVQRHYNWDAIAQKTHQLYLYS